MEKIKEYEKLKNKLELLQNKKEKIKDDEYHQAWQVDNLNAFIRETKRRIKRIMNN